MSFIIFNSKIVPSNQACIPYNDRGFTLGHGLFETIRVNKNAIPTLDYHWRRLETSATLIGINIPFSKENLATMISELLTENSLQEKITAVRLTISHGESARGILPQKIPQPNFVISAFEYTPHKSQTFSAMIVNARKNEHALSSRIKSTSYLDNILAKQEAVQQGYDEAILLNTTSNVADGTISNIYMVKADQVFTPSISDGALPGVIRTILLEECHDLCPITEKSITFEELMSADEIFLTNALMGVTSLTKLNNKKFSSFHISGKMRYYGKENI